MTARPDKDGHELCHDLDRQIVSSPSSPGSIDIEQSFFRHAKWAVSPCAHIDAPNTPLIPHAGRTFNLLPHTRNLTGFAPAPNARQSACPEFVVQILECTNSEIGQWILPDSY